MKGILDHNPEEWNAQDAGTTFRFLTAFAAMKMDNKVLTGTPRMLKRPIGILADALNMLGAKIEYLGERGYPPLRIQKLEDQKSDSLEIQGNISSQYISALLMIAPTLPKGLELKLEGKVVSRSYIEMTLNMMAYFLK